MRHLFLLISFFALGFSCLRSPTIFAEVIFCTVAAIGVIIATSIAFIRQKQKTIANLILPVVASGYILYSHIPDPEGFIPRQVSSEPTTQLLMYTYSNVFFNANQTAPEDTEVDLQSQEKQGFNTEGFQEAAQDPFLGIQASPDPFEVATTLEPSVVLLPPPQNLAGLRPFFDEKSRLSRFLRIGHVLCGTFLGYSVFVVSVFLTRKGLEGKPKR